MKKYNKTVCVYDYGLFHCVAEKLAEDVERVLYTTPTYKSAFPKSSQKLIGQGLPGIERIPKDVGEPEFWDFIRKKEIDTVVFPDIMDGAIQMHLRDLGIPVWGSGLSDRLEIDRSYFRKLQDKLGMPIPETVFITGISKLKKYLKDKTDVWVKISLYRGDLETFHFLDWNTCEEKLEEWEYVLGAQKELCDFIVESPIKGVEPGYDGWCIDGNYPEITAYGYETKGCCYLGKIVPYKDLPEVMQYTNKTLSPIFKKMGLRGFYSNELKVDEDKEGYVIDLTQRAGSPPTEVVIESYKNIAEIIMEGAKGNLVKPIQLGKYMALARICSTEAEKNWMTVEFPKDIYKYVKLRNACFINNKFQIAPSMSSIGSLIGIGNTIDEAINMIKKNADKIKGMHIEILVDKFDETKKEIETGKKYGIPF